MSFVIVYSRQFVRLPVSENREEDIILPLALYGDNNVTETVFGRERRCRHWNVFGNSDMYITTERELMDIVRNLYGHDTCHDCFKYNGKWLDGAKVIRFYQNGCRDARTIEEIRLLKPHESLNCAIGYYTRNDQGHEVYRECDVAYIHDSAELADWLFKAKEKYGRMVSERTVSWVYLKISFSSLDEPLNLGATAGMHKNSAPVVVKHKNSYICEVTDTSVSFGPAEKAMVFDSIEAASLQIPKWWFSHEKHIRFVKAETAKKPRPYAIFFTEGPRSGSYLDHLTRNKLYSAISPKHIQKKFSTPKEAQKYFEEKIKPRYLRFTACEIRNVEAT